MKETVEETFLWKKLIDSVISKRSGKPFKSGSNNGMLDEHRNNNSGSNSAIGLTSIRMTSKTLFNHKFRKNKTTMNKTRRIWLMVLSLAAIGAGMFLTIMGVLRTGGPIKILSFILTLGLGYLAYEAIVFFGKEKVENKQETPVEEKETPVEEKETQNQNK